MRAVGLKVLKNKLSEYVRLAAAGETILISDRDRVVAELVPPRETRSHTLGDAMLAELFREGFLSPPLSSHGPLAGSTGIMPLDEVLADLEADRAER